MVLMSVQSSPSWCRSRGQTVCGPKSPCQHPISRLGGFCSQLSSACWQFQSCKTNGSTILTTEFSRRNSGSARLTCSEELQQIRILDLLGCGQSHPGFCRSREKGSGHFEEKTWWANKIGKSRPGPSRLHSSPAHPFSASAPATRQHRIRHVLCCQRTASVRFTSFAFIGLACHPALAQPQSSTRCITMCGRRPSAGLMDCPTTDAKSVALERSIRGKAMTPLAPGTPLRPRAFAAVGRTVWRRYVGYSVNLNGSAAGRSRFASCMIDDGLLIRSSIARYGRAD